MANDIVDNVMLRLINVRHRGRAPRVVRQAGVVRQASRVRLGV